MRTARDAAAAFLEALIATPGQHAQNRLLNTADRDLAAILFHLQEEERESVYRVMGPAKSARLRSELIRMGHVRLDDETVARISAHLVEHLGSDKPLGSASRYFRPRKPR